MRKHLSSIIAGLALVAIAGHLLLRFYFHVAAHLANIPLLAALAIGGTPLVFGLLVKLIRREFGSDLLAGISIVTSVILGEYLAGSLVVLMLSGGEALEAFAVRSASSVLQALARRMPSVAHRKSGGQISDVALAEIVPGDTLIVFPHEICPVDGVVIEGNGGMDEAYLTGEPYRLSKAPGSQVISGATNGNAALTIRATRLAVDSRYARIMQVMRASEKNRPRIRRLGDQIGAVFTPIAVGIAVVAWIASGQAWRFLAVLVVATPCPLLIAIPVAVIGSVSLAARRGIIIKNQAVLERVDTCRVAIFDKTGTLTYGEPKLVRILCAADQREEDILRLTASVERYSKHPLAAAILEAARQGELDLRDAAQISETAGQGLTGIVAGKTIHITGRNKISAALAEQLPAAAEGLECVILVDDRYAATMRFADQPRAHSRGFIDHLGPRHRLERILLVSGDREEAVRRLAETVGISEIHAGKTPEEKLDIVTAETKRARTLFVGDGINDAPALMAATVGVALGTASDITSEAAGAVIMDNSLEKVDEFLH
ncbi:MAG TPA: heavy metal translocating P-type ATPase, partial [Tepidisphaeraceae bacterium]|nr:heavy metal translocating P-type ATPase [Tepidisphaeraceae bacterium]